MASIRPYTVRGGRVLLPPGPPKLAFHYGRGQGGAPPQKSRTTQAEAARPAESIDRLSNNTELGRKATRMTRAREIVLILLTAGIIFFAYQNLGSEEVTFLFWEFQVPVALIALVPLLAGLVIGAGSTAVFIRRRRRLARSAAGGEEPGPEETPEEEQYALGPSDAESIEPVRPEERSVPRSRPR